LKKGGGETSFFVAEKGKRGVRGRKSLSEGGGIVILNRYRGEAPRKSPTSTKRGKQYLQSSISLQKKKGGSAKQSPISRKLRFVQDGGRKGTFLTIEGVPTKKGKKVLDLCDQKLRISVGKEILRNPRAPSTRGSAGGFFLLEGNSSKKGIMAL